MRRGIRTMIAFVLLLGVVILPATMIDDQSEGESRAVTNITFYGYVSDVSDQEKNVPLPGVTVTLLDERMNPMGTSNDVVTTDEDGMFKFICPADKIPYLKFELAGYTIRFQPNTFSSTDTNDVVKIELDMGKLEADNTYSLSGDGYSKSAIGMGLTMRTLQGSVIGAVGNEEPHALEGAVVTATSPETGRSYSTKADSNGEFELTVPYGEYSIYATCNGFYKSKEILVDTSTDTPVMINLDQREFGIGFFAGLDVAHGTLAIGLVVIVVVVLWAIALVYKSREPDSEIIVVIRDETSEDEDEFNRL